MDVSEDISIISVQYIKMAGLSESGRIIPAQPTPFTGHTQTITGSPLEAAAATTLTQNATMAAAAKSLGVGQKGGRRKQRGGSNLAVHLPSLPQAGTIAGVSHENVHVAGVNNYNQMKADGAGDGLINATPVKLGGNKTKRRAKNGRKFRTRRRRSVKSRNYSRKRRRSLHKHVAKIR